MHIKGLQKQLREFAVAREWQGFHSPKNLAMALMVESAELLELFQWLTTEQSNTLTKEPADKEKVADEIADVMLYLLQIADCTGVDLEKAVQSKIAKNAEKYPPKNPESTLPKSKVHLLVDWENVQPDAQALQALEPEGTDIWIFHAPVQYNDAQKHQKTYGANSVTLVERTGSGKNALDFQLSYYAGYLMARQPEARFVVVSNDKGYEPMLEHARKLEFQAQRVGYRKPPAAPKSVLKPLAQALKVDRPSPDLLSDSQSSPSAAQIACRTRTVLRGLQASSRPVDWCGLMALAQGLMNEGAVDKRNLAEKACALLQLRGTVRRDTATGQVQYCFAADPLPHQDQVPPKVAVAMPSHETAVALVPAVRSESSARKLTTSATKKPPAHAVAVSKPSAKKQLQDAVKKVQAALTKMAANAPKKRDGLMNLIQSHLQSLSETVSAEKVCGALQSLKVVRLSKQGQVSYPLHAEALVQQPKAKKRSTTSKSKSASMKPVSSPPAVKSSASPKKKVKNVTTRAAA